MAILIWVYGLKCPVRDVEHLFEILYLLFSWLPPPLDKLFFGAFCILLVIVLMKLISAIIDMIPFL